METCFAFDAAGVGVDSGHAPVAVVAAVPALVEVGGFVYFFAPAGVDGDVEVGDEFACEAEAVVDSVAVGREGVGDEEVVAAAGYFNAVNGYFAIPGATEGVGNGDAVDGDGVGWGGEGIGRGGAVEGVAVGPGVGGAGYFGGVEADALGEEEDGVVGPGAEVPKGGVLDDDGGVAIGAAGGVVEVDDVGAGAEVLDEGVGGCGTGEAIGEVYPAVAVGVAEYG